MDNKIRKVMQAMITEEIKKIHEAASTIKNNDDYRKLLNQLQDLKKVWEKIMRESE